MALRALVGELRVAQRQIGPGRLLGFVSVRGYATAEQQVCPI